MKKYILSLLAVAFLPMATWAQDEPEPEPVIVEINETNFPDPNFRAVVETFNTDGEEGLSEAEIAAVTKLDLNNKGIADLTGLEHFTATKSLNLQKNKFNSLDVSALTELSSLKIAQTKSEVGESKLTTLDVSNNKKLYQLHCAGLGLTSLDLSSNQSLQYLYCSDNNISDLKLPAKEETDNNKLVEISVSNNPIGSIDVSYFKKLKSFMCFYCGLSELDVTNNLQLATLQCNNNNIKDLDVSQSTSMTTLRCQYNPIEVLDVSRMTKLEVLECNMCNIDKLDLTSSSNLRNLQCESNRLTTLDLSKNEKLQYISMGQAKVVDAIVIDREKIAIEVIPSSSESVLSNDLFLELNGSVADASAQEYIEKDGKCYLVIAKPTDKKDVNLYEATVKYKFNTQCPNSSQKDEPMLVTITTYPYIMYVNPASEDQKDGFYSGTLIVDYDAVVPEGAEAYIATGVTLDSETMIMDGEKVTFDQLSMTKVGDAGDVIPANTPIYVKSATETGLFAFARNLEEKDLVTIPDGNILEGTLVDKSVTPGQVLTLGREDKKGTGAVGFWAFLGSTVPAHRVFIDSTVLQSSDGANGFTLNFDGAADGINSLTTTTTADGAYYTLQGIKVSEPTQKGVYIYNGKKIMVK